MQVSIPRLLVLAFALQTAALAEPLIKLEGNKPVASVVTAWSSSGNKVELTIRAGVDPKGVAEAIQGGVEGVKAKVQAGKVVVQGRAEADLLKALAAVELGGTDEFGQLPQGARTASEDSRSSLRAKETSAAEKRQRAQNVASCRTDKSCRGLVDAAFKDYVTVVVTNAGYWGTAPDSEQLGQANVGRARARRSFAGVCLSTPARAFLDERAGVFHKKVRAELIALANALDAVMHAQTRDDRMIAADDYNRLMAAFNMRYGRAEAWYDAQKCTVRGSVSEKIRTCSAWLESDGVAWKNWCPAHGTDHGLEAVSRCPPDVRADEVAIRDYWHRPLTAGELPERFRRLVDPSSRDSPLCANAALKKRLERDLQRFDATSPEARNLTASVRAVEELMKTLESLDEGVGLSQQE